MSSSSTVGAQRLADQSLEDFAAGTLGSSGQNTYVSRRGVLQRIAYSSLTGSGYVDIPYANSHDDRVALPTYVFRDPLQGEEKPELDSRGAFADLTVDGYEDIVVANQYDGATNELHAQVYFGGPDRWSHKRMLELWAASSKNVVIGRFEAGATQSNAFVSKESLCIFNQGEHGFTSRGYRDIQLLGPIESLVAADPDRDGVDDLVVRSPDSSVPVHWGGPWGVGADRCTFLDMLLTGDAEIDTRLDAAAMGAAGGRTQLPGYFPVDVGVADLNNDDHLDIVATNHHGHQQRDLDTYIYWGRGGQFHPHRVTRLFHHSARGVLLAEFNEDGLVDTAIANHNTYGNHPGDSDVWYNSPDGFVAANGVDLPTGGLHGLSHQDFGDVYDRGPEENFISRALGTGGGGVCTGPLWQGEIPAKTWVAGGIRTVTTEAGLETADWAPIGDGVSVDEFVQHRLALGAVNTVATPRVTAVEMFIEPGVS